MKKINLIWISALILIITSISVIAWVNCTPSACDAGYTDNGIYCIGGTCYRNCTGFTCTSGSWTQVYSDEITYGGTTADEDDTSGTYTASNNSACYKFNFEGSGDDFYLDVDDIYYDPVGSATNCDGEAIAGFWESGKPSHPWYENLSDTGNLGTRYWGDVSYATFDYFFIAARSHTNTDWMDDNNYDDPMEVNYAIYCAPTAEGCDVIADYSTNCDIGCYNKGTYMYNYQGHQKDYDTSDDGWMDNNDNLRKSYECPNSNVGSNYFNIPYYKVYISATTPIDKDTSCERTNEAPTASGVNVIPLNATASQDLVCNYTYTDSEDYEEKDSTYEWWNNTVNQNINSQILGKGNLTVNDQWYCKVTPSDGLLNGTKQQSSNTVTILSTIQNPKMYIEDSLAWSSDGYFDKANVLDFSDEINNALDSCTADADGYCNISIKFSSDSNGTLNVSGIGVYYEEQETLPDTTPPFITIISPVNNTSYQLTSIDLNWTANETLDWCAYSLNGEANNTDICPSGIPTNITLTSLSSGKHNITIWANDTSGNMGQSDYVYFNVTLPDINKFYITNSSGNNIAWFGDFGNIVIKGTLEQSSAHTATANDEFRFQDSNGNDVMIVDMTNGNMYIDGNLSENQNTLTPPQDSDDFIVLNETNDVVAYINESGYMFLKGTLIENGDP